MIAPNCKSMLSYLSRYSNSCVRSGWPMYSWSHLSPIICAVMFMCMYIYVIICEIVFVSHGTGYWGRAVLCRRNTKSFHCVDLLTIWSRLCQLILDMGAEKCRVCVSTCPYLHDRSWWLYGEDKDCIYCNCCMYCRCSNDKHKQANTEVRP